MIRVYRFSLRPATANADLVREHIRGAHDYANDLVAIERGRRGAMRALHVGPDVEAAAESLRVATRSDKRAAKIALNRARHRAEIEARCAGGYWAVEEAEADRYPFSPLFEVERLKLLEASIRRDAYALARCAWGTRQTVAAAADQSRKADMYDRDGLTPNDVRFRRAHFVPERGEQRHGEGQIAIHVQNRVLTVAELLAGKDNQARLVMGGRGADDPKAREYGTLWLALGTVDRRTPIWATFPIRLHRALPDHGLVSWVRVSCRHEGPWIRWSCEITVDDRRAEHPHLLDTTLDGAIALEPCWERPGDELRVARWADSAGETGEVVLGARDVEGFAKIAGLRSVRDQIRNDVLERLGRELVEMRPASPPAWLVTATSTLSLWKSPGRLYELDATCRREGLAGPFASILREWTSRDMHLWQYEAGARRKILGRRKDLYQRTAVDWGGRYKTLIVDTRNFSLLARFGPESELRFMAAPSELREAIRAAFGPSVVEYKYAEPVDADGDPLPQSWAEIAIERWRAEQSAGGARADKIRKRVVHGKGGAWAARKNKKASRATDSGSARNAVSEAAK